MPFEFHLADRLRVVQTLPATINLGIAPTHDATVTMIRDFLSGTGVDQIDMIYAKRRSIATGATDVIDINGSTNDVFGTNIAMVTLCGVIIINQDVDGTANTTNLTFGGGANAIGSILGNASVTKTLRPGHIFQDINGSTGGIGAVTPGTNDSITIVNAAGATNNYQIIIFGRST